MNWLLIRENWKGNHPVVKTFSPELVAGDARFDGKFHTETKAGWSPCTGGRNLPISSLDHHSLLNQRHCFQALPITSPELRVVHTGTGRSFSEASFQEHRDTVLWCYTLGWLLLRNLWGPVLQGESKGIQSARARAGSHGTHLTSSSHKKGTQRDNTKQERFLAVSLPSLKLYSWY